MAFHYRTQGLVIKKNNWGEADQLLTIYTRDFGKLEILGKAIRKIKSKLRGGADIFYLSEIEFIQGKTHKTLTDAILIDSFPNIKKDLERPRIAHQIVELLDSLISEEEKDVQVWQLLNETFVILNRFQLSNTKCQLLYYYFFWNIISFLGYQPEIRVDSVCGKKIDTDLAKILKIITKRDWQLLSRLKIKSNHLELLKNISGWYIIEIYEK